MRVKERAHFPCPVNNNNTRILDRDNDSWWSIAEEVAMDGLGLV